MVVVIDVFKLNTLLDALWIHVKRRLITDYLHILRWLYLLEVRRIIDLKFLRAWWLVQQVTLGWSWELRMALSGHYQRSSTVEGLSFHLEGIAYGFCLEILTELVLEGSLPISFSLALISHAHRLFVRTCLCWLSMRVLRLHIWHHVAKLDWYRPLIGQPVAMVVEGVAVICRV